MLDEDGAIEVYEVHAANLSCGIGIGVSERAWHVTKPGSGSYHPA